MSKLELNEINDEYIEKMTAFEVECNNKTEKSNGMACHQVAEFFGSVLNDHKRAAPLYEKNCSEFNFPASCFNLGRLFFTGKGVESNDEQALTYFSKRL